MKAAKYILISAATFTLGQATAAAADTDGLAWHRHGDYEVELNAGVNIGGSSPLPLPREIRRIDSYNPRLNLSIGGQITRFITPEWGIAVGLRFESKGMKTSATVKNYGMEIIQDGSRVAGRWTGKVETLYDSNFLTIPVTAVRRINDRWKVAAGPYISFDVSKGFSGFVHDGYLREGDPTGDKVTFEGDSQAPYDFSDELRTFQWGLQAGGSWLATTHFAVNATLVWGLNDIFKGSFKTVNFNLYPIYANFGFSYLF